MGRSQHGSGERWGLWGIPVSQVSGSSPGFARPSRGYAHIPPSTPMTSRPKDPLKGAASSDTCSLHLHFSSLSCWEPWNSGNLGPGPNAERVSRRVVGPRGYGDSDVGGSWEGARSRRTGKEPPPARALGLQRVGLQTKCMRFCNFLTRPPSSLCRTLLTRQKAVGIQKQKNKNFFSETSLLVYSCNPITRKLWHDCKLRPAWTKA